MTKQNLERLLKKLNGNELRSLAKKLSIKVKRDITKPKIIVLILNKEIPVVLNELGISYEAQINSEEGLILAKKGLKKQNWELIIAVCSLLLTFFTIIWTIFTYYNPKPEINNEFGGFNNTPTITKIDSITKFTPADSSFLKVAILPFQPSINCRELDISYKEQLIERFKVKIEEEQLPLTIIAYDSVDCPSTNKEAEEFGKSINADLVIWGNYEEDSNGPKSIRIRYNLIKNLKYSSDKKSGDSKMQPLPSLEKLRHGYLQKNVDYIIHWSLGIIAFKESNLNQVISQFSLLIDSFNVTEWNVNNLLALSYLNSENTINAELIFQKMLANAKGSGDSLATYFNLRKVYIKNEDFLKLEALKLQTLRMEVAHFKKGNMSTTRFGSSLSNIGMFYYRYSEYKKAKWYLLSSLKYQDDFPRFDFSPGFSHITLAKIFYKEKNWNEIIHHLESSKPFFRIQNFTKGNLDWIELQLDFLECNKEFLTKKTDLSNNTLFDNWF